MQAREGGAGDAGTDERSDLWRRQRADQRGAQRGGLVHTPGDARYRWLNDRVCAVEGEVRPRFDGSGSEVVFEVSEMVWEGVSARTMDRPVSG